MNKFTFMFIFLLLIIILLFNLSFFYENFSTNSEEEETSSYFDTFNLSCLIPYKRPVICTNIKGNYVNIFPLDYCKKVCPERIKKDYGTDKSLKAYERNITAIKENFACKNKYYCWNGKTCDTHNYDCLNPAKNKCGQNSIAQVPLYVYNNKEQCIRDNTTCNNLPKSECLQRSKCGWCTNSLGEGICTRGTPSGPFNYNLPCWPSTGTDRNNYTQGLPNQFFTNY